jgi:hypothetical protein
LLDGVQKLFLPWHLVQNLSWPLPILRNRGTEV